MNQTSSGRNPTGPSGRPGVAAADGIAGLPDDRAVAGAGVLEAAPDAAAAAANGDVDAIVDIMELSPFRIERFYAQYEHTTLHARARSTTSRTVPAPASCGLPGAG